MTRPADRPGEFAKARARAEVDARRLRALAARTVAGQATSDDDRSRLLSMLGLDDIPPQPARGHATGGDTVSLRDLERGMSGYVRAVAAQLGVPLEATGFEISDTVTAYLGLPDRCADCPNRDLMLVWNEQDGWLVAAETHPTEPVRVIGYLGGYDILPHPRTVGQFVTSLLSGHRLGRFHPTHRPLTARDLVALLGRHHPPAGDRPVTSRINPLP